MTDTLIRYIRVFEGPRHDKLYKIWAEVERRLPPTARLWVAPNPGPHHKPHAEKLNDMWRASYDEPERFVIFTEHDFLPALNKDWCSPASFEGNDFAAIAPLYVTREPRTLRVVAEEYWREQYPGAWFMMFDKHRCPRDLDFREGRKVGKPDRGPDPANLLKDQISVALVKGVDAFPAIRYPTGTHLFFSHLYNSDPTYNGSGTGIPTGAILTGVDGHIRAYANKHRIAL